MEKYYNNTFGFIIVNSIQTLYNTNKLLKLIAKVFFKWAVQEIVSGKDHNIIIITIRTNNKFRIKINNNNNNNSNKAKIYKINIQINRTFIKMKAKCFRSKILNKLLL